MNTFFTLTFLLPIASFAMENTQDLQEVRQGTITVTKAMQAAYNGQEGIVENFLNTADVETKDENGSTLLMWAASGDQDKIVEKLILHGANLNYQRPDKMTALIYACLSGGAKALGVLLKAGANTALTDLHGHTILMNAASGARGKDANIEAVKLLLKKGVSPTLQVKDGGHFHVANQEAYDLIREAQKRTRIV